MFTKYIFKFRLLLFFSTSIYAEQTTNDTSIFSDIWGSLTQSEKVPSCPGECIHAITSIFCDHVLENVPCAQPYLRCCVPNDFSYGTPVETSPPLVEEELHNYTVTSSVLTKASSVHSTTAVSSSPPLTTVSPLKPTATYAPTTFKPSTTSTFSSSPFSSSSSATTLSTSSTRLSASVSSENSCPGVCMKLQYAKYCGNLLKTGFCDYNEACCLQSEKDTVNHTKPVFGAPSENRDTFPGDVEKVLNNQHKTNTFFNTSATTISTTVTPTTTVSTTPKLPDCDGTCVTSLFSLLCDKIDDTKYCPDEGFCCIYTDTPTEPSVPPCDGTCLPIILSGVCNRPSEILFKTSTCTSGTVCCQPGSQSAYPSESYEPRPTRPPMTNKQSTTPMFYPSPMNNNRIPLVPPTITIHQRPNSPYPHFPLSPQANQPIGPAQVVPSPQPSLPPSNHNLIPHYPPHAQRPPVLNNQNVPLPMQPQPSLPSSLPPSTSPSPPPPQPLLPVENVPVHMSDPTVDINSQGVAPFCPGPCIAPFLRFTCFGGNTIYPGFLCAKHGHICCASINDIQAYEVNVLANNGVWNNQQYIANVTAKPTELRPVTSGFVTVKPVTRPQSPYICGVKGVYRPETPRVVGGRDSLPNEWCWQIALINTQRQYLCGGALIGPQWVLTAAHCVTTLVRNSEPIFVRVGAYDLAAEPSMGQTVKVSTTYIHHNHNTQTLDNDIALLKLENPVELGESICMVCLPARGTNRKPGKKCTVTGYGYLAESGPIALKIREAEVPIVDDQQCTVKINAVTEKLFILPTSSFCAGGEEGNDACQGDGGGPLVCEVDGYHELTGIVSWGFGCGREDVPAVYVKVSNFIGWINQIISVNNQ